MARGGRRKGTAGKAYGQRTDLNGPAAKPMAVPGQQYGEQGKQIAAQKAMPMGTPDVPGPGGPLAGYSGPMPNDLPSLLGAESNRPDIPLTAGLTGGPGPGPEALDPLTGRLAPRPGFDDLEAVYQAFPYPGIRALIQWSKR